MAVEIRPSVVKQQIEDGMKKKELADYYGLPMTQMTKVLQQLGLRIKQNHLPKFVILSEDNTSIVEANTVVTDDMGTASESFETTQPINTTTVGETTESEW